VNQDKEEGGRGGRFRRMCQVVKDLQRRPKSRL